MSEYTSFLEEYEERQRNLRRKEEELRQQELAAENEDAPAFLKWWLPRGVAGAAAGVANLFGADIQDNFGLGLGFLPGMWGVGHLSKVSGVMAGTGKIAGIARGAAAGAIADFSVFDGNDARLSNLIQDMPELANPVTEWLASDEEDDEIEGRIKNVLEGALLGGISEPIFAMLKGMKRFNKASRGGDQAGMDLAKRDIEGAAEDAFNGSENPELDDMVDAARDGGDRTDAAKQAEQDDDLLAPRTKEKTAPETITENPADLAEPGAVDVNGGDVLVIDTEDPSGLLRGFSNLQDVAELPGTRLGLVQLKPQGDLKVAKSHTARQEGIKRPPGMGDDEWLAYRRDALRERGYQVLIEERGGRRVAHVLDDSAVLQRIEVAPTSGYIAKKERQRQQQQRDPDSPLVKDDPVEKTRELTGTTQQQLEEAADALLAREAQARGEARMADLGVEGAEDPAAEKIAGLLNIEKQTSADQAHTAVALIETLGLRQIAGEAGVQTHEDLINSIAKSELPRMLGQDPTTVANTLLHSAGNVTAAYRQAKAASLVMDHLAGQIKKLSQDLTKKSGNISATEISKMTGDPALPIDEVANLLMKQMDAYAALSVAYGKVRGEFGRGLNSFNITVDRMLSNEIAKGVIDRGGRTQMVRMARRIADLDSLKIAEMASRDQLKGLMDRITPYYMFSLLSKPATLATNLISTGLMGIFAPLEKAAGAWLQASLRRNPEAKASMSRYILQQMRTARRRAGIMSNTALLRDSPALSTIMESSKVSAQTGRSVLTGRASAMNEVARRDLPVPKDAGSALSQNLSKIIGLPGQAMAGSDEYFKQLFYMTEITEHLRAVGEMDLGLSGTTLETWVHHKSRQFLINGQAATEKVVRENIERGIEVDAYINPMNREKEIQARMQRAMTDVTPEDFVGPTAPSVPLAPGESMFDIAERAMKLAETETFTRNLEDADGFLAKAGSHLQGLADAYPAVRLIAPFIRTPMNILIETNKRLPIPIVNKNMTNALALMSDKLIKGATGKSIPTLEKMGQDLRAKLMSSDPQVAAETAGQLMVAGSLASTAMLVAGTGVITGKGPQDPEAQKALRSVGWQEYSIRVGDTFVSFQRLDPLGGMLGFIGDMSDLARYSGKDQDLSDLTYAATLSVMRNISDKSYISGLVDLAGAVKDPDRYLSKLANRLAGTVVPNVIAGAGAAMDPTLKESYSIMDSIQRRVPFLSDTMDKQRNFLGEPLSRKMMSKGMAQTAGWVDYMLPISVNTVGSGVIEREIETLMYPMNEPDPNRFGVDLRDFYTPEGQSAYDRWQELTSEVSIGGRKLRSAVERLIKSRKYQSLPTESYRESGLTSPRVLEIRKLVNKYRRRAQKMVLNEFPQLQEETAKRRLIMERQRRGAGADEILDLLGG
jgi:hypothetical protein